MTKHFQTFSALLILTIMMVACTSPAVEGGTQPSSSDQVATVVVMTLQALTSEVDAGQTPEPEAPADALLPHTFYFLGTDNAGLTQVFRIERDGKTQKQITFEPESVKDYDVSLADGSVAYVAGNQLLLVNADGSDRHLVVDGGPVDENNPFLSMINSPVFSPNGQTLAYGYKGLNLYAISSGVSNLVIENQIEDSGGFPFPKELYWPEHFSPDGTKLLITLGYYEGASAAIYDPASKALVRVTGSEGALICCDETVWSADGSSFYSASSTTGMFSSGLWRVDATTGVVTTLLPGEAGDGTFNFADEPYLAPDGRLYFFFANFSPPPDVFGGRTPLQLVRSAPDGVTGRTVLRPDTFELMNESLWAPDASFIVVAFAPTGELYQGGRAEIVYPDSRPNAVLTTFAQQMKWGP